jgi:hypothetical protein
MPKKIVRVPIAGFVQISVDAPNAKAAESLAYTLVNDNLSPRDGVTDLNALLSAEDFYLATDTFKESMCIDENHIEF